MDIYAVLKKDHDAVKSLLETLSESTEKAVKTREKNFDKLRMELDAHSRVEEALVYARLEQEDETRDLILEGREEHHVVDGLLEELASMPVDDEQWTAKITVLKEQVEHHVEEEEGELFKKAKKILDKDEAQTLAEQFQEQKKQHLAQLKGAA